MQRDDIIEMARQAGFSEVDGIVTGGISDVEAFAKLVATKAIAKDREEFDIDELCARQNKIGYKQGYNTGKLEERESCAKLCDAAHPNTLPAMLGMQIRARGDA
jgi:hypothetical protein